MPHKKHNQVILKDTICFIAESEYQRVINENIELRLKVANLEGQNKQLKNLLDERDKTIDDLKKENEKLKARIDALEGKVSQQTNIINKLVNKQIVSTFIIALQDLNDDERLNSKACDNCARRGLARLHAKRVDDCHYIYKGKDSGDNDDLKTYKKKILLKKLKEASKDVIDTINKRTSKYFIENVIEFLDTLPNNYKVTDDDIEDVDNWWDDHM